MRGAHDGLMVKKHGSLVVRFAPHAAARAWRAKGFPHYSLSSEERVDKLRKLIDYDFSSVIKRNVVKQMTYFNPLASWYFPHMWTVPAGGKRTPAELFADPKLLPEAMKKRGEMRRKSMRELEEEMGLPNIFRDFLPSATLTRSGVQKALRTYSGTQGVSNFSPVSAAALYCKFLPEEGGVVWDPSCGWGGRLAGAIACGKVHKYIGCDPSTETFKGLLRMRDELLPMARSMGRNLEVELHMLGSQTKEMRAALPRRGVDVIFSSPPYYGQEEYSDEPTQSYIEFPTPDAWLNGFMRMTLDNCAYCLKQDGTLAINIADVSDYPGNLKDDFVSLAEDNGWKLVKTLKLELSVMLGTRSKQKGKHKHEPIFVFKRK
jgi:hypothetical protein